MPDLGALAAHLHGLLAGRAAGGLCVWSRPLIRPHHDELVIESIESIESIAGSSVSGGAGAITIRFQGAAAAALTLVDPEDVVLDEHGLRVRTAAQITFGAELRADRLSAAWVRLTAGDAEPRELETARREALQLEPAPGADWLGAHGA